MNNKQAQTQAKRLNVNYKYKIYIFRKRLGVCTMYQVPKFGLRLGLGLGLVILKVIKIYKLYIRNCAIMCCDVTSDLVHRASAKGCHGDRTENIGHSFSQKSR
jgi:hypothetical protein